MRKLYSIFILSFLLTQFNFGQILNGNLEGWTSGSPDSWYMDSGITITQENTIIHGGSASANVEVTTTTQASTDFYQTTVNVNAGAPYTLHAWVYHTEGNIKARLVADGIYGTYSNNTLTGSWQEITFNFNPSSSIITIGLRFYDQPGFDGSEIVYVDDIFFSGGEPTEPSAETGSAINISATSATLTGTVTDNGANTNITFEWGTSAGVYTSSGDADPASIVAGAGTTSVTKFLDGLTTGFTYYYRVYATNSVGTTYGIEKSFVATDPPVNLVISEIMQNPSDVSDNAGEWFEIYNPETFDVNIDGYTIKDNGSNSHLIDNGGSLIIPAGGFIVLGINSDATSNGGLTVDYQYSGFTLANADDEVILIYTDGTTVIDEVWYDGGTNFPDPTGASMYLTNLTLDNNTGANWATATVREGTYDASGSDYGSPGAIGTEAVYPVELTSFTAITMTKGIMLNWSTATEVNNYGFEIERSSTSLGTIDPSRAETREWEKIGFVEGHGNSNSPNDYSYLDNSKIFGEVSYRLKQIDTDGAFEYSDVVTVTSKTLAKYELYQNYPNPFNPSTVVSFTLPEMSHVKIAVYNVIGQEVAKLVDKEMEAGFHNITFDGSNLSTGLYIYRLETPNYSKTMKMILLR